jgi:hypothetical protein
MTGLFYSWMPMRTQWMAHCTPHLQDLVYWWEMESIHYIQISQLGQRGWSWCLPSYRQSQREIKGRNKQDHL